MTTQPTVPRLSDHFPRVEKPCKDVAKKFFDCFYENGKMNDKEVRSHSHFIIRFIPSIYDSFQDASAGARGLEKCADKMSAYDKCMTRVLEKTPPAELYRVSGSVSYV